MSIGDVLPAGGDGATGNYGLENIIKEKKDY
jgi:hypothetical protein